jgi:TRAP transporter TAXI family solute receptor
MVRRRHALFGILAAAGVAVAVPGLLRVRRSTEVAHVAQLRVATGPPGGVFREIGGALARVLRSRLPHTKITCVPTDASLANLALLDGGEADLAFAAMDTITGSADAGHPHDVRAVARLFDSWMQVLVPYDSPITALNQLQDKPVAAGALKSGTRFTTERLLAVAQLRPQLLTMTQDAGAAALENGSVAAWFTCTGAPTPAVSTLARRMPLRLLPLTAHLGTMTTVFGTEYNIATLPSTTYPGVSGTASVTTPNLLLARREVPPSVVEVVLEGLFANIEQISREHPEATEIDERSGAATMPVPLHEGALRYFRAEKPYAF